MFVSIYLNLELNIKNFKLGVLNIYKHSHLEERQWLHFIFGLPFWNPESVGYCFTDDMLAVLPQYVKFMELIVHLVV